MFEFIGGALFIDCECGLFKDGDCGGGGGGGGGGAAPLWLLTLGWSGRLFMLLLLLRVALLKLYKNLN